MEKSDYNLDLRLFLKLLTPSVISSFICAIASLALSFGVILLNHYKSSSVRLEFLYYQSHRTTSSLHLPTSLLQNSLVNNLALFTFWGVVGMVVYLLANDIVKAVQETVEVEHELDYVNVDRKQLIRSVVEQLVIRLMVLVLLLPYILFFFHKIIPYTVALALVAATGNVSITPAYIALSVIVMFIALHINVILLRLLLLKPRIFN